MNAPTYTLDELAALAATKPRTVRYYIQLGLVDRPDGETRAATYGARHLEQLLAVRRYQESGLSLEQIRAGVESASVPQEVRPRYAGAVEVWSRVTLADGVELSLEPGRAGLSAEQVRRLSREIVKVFENLKKESEE
jgi:DNA-binding transcriptional MerR regulator